MTTLAHTQTASGNEEQVTSGSVCKVAVAAAVLSIISLFSADQLSRVQFAPIVATDLAHESELHDLLCRIDRRCPTARDASRMQAANMKTAQTSVR